MVVLSSSTVAVSTLGTLLLGSRKTISDINQECSKRGLSPAFYRTNIGDGMIYGNPDYRFEGFGLAFDSIMPPKPKITFWVHYKPSSHEHKEIGVFGIPISIGQMDLYDLFKGIGSMGLEDVNMKGEDETEHTVPVVSNAFTANNISSTEPASTPPFDRQERVEPFGPEFVPLKSGAIDSVGASRYRKTANVPGLVVTALQQNLTDLGLKLGEVDGWFGDNTEKALKAFQRSALEKRRLQANREVEAPITYQGYVLGEYDLPTHTEIQVWVRNEYRVLKAGEPLVVSEVVGASSTTNLAQPSRWNLALAQAPTSGASGKTAAANGYQAGIEASFKMAEKDWPLVQPLMPKFICAGEMFNVPASVLAGIASRESHAGSVLDGCWGDNGNGFGIMQVDKRYHQLEGPLDDPASQEHIKQAARIFASYLQQVEQKHSAWEDAYILKGAAAAYNFGVDNVQTKAGIDRGTTGDDYGSDVLARAQFYARRLGQLSDAAVVQPLASTSNGDIQLSPHFMLSEMIRSETASRKGIDNYPKDEAIIKNLKALCENVLEPVRQHFGKPISPTSGYRCLPLNRAIGSSDGSQHVQGQAADFVVPGVSKNTVLQWIRNNLDYDQLIDEFGSTGWIHVSYRANGGNRKSSFSIG
jgi:hypothetical protein